jgi:hypothetical protein
MAEKTNVIEIGGQEYDPNDLTDKQKYWITQVRDLQTKRANAQFQLDQIAVALDYFTNELLGSLEKDKTDA